MSQGKEQLGFETLLFTSIPFIFIVTSYLHQNIISFEQDKKPEIRIQRQDVLEKSEELCTLRFESLDEAVIAQLTKKEATMQGYLYGFEDALQLLQTMLDEGIEPPKRGKA